MMKKLISAIALTLLTLVVLTLSVSGMAFVGAVSEDEVAPDYLAIFAIDGDESKFWHTQWEGDIKELPTSIYFEMDGIYNIEGVTILPRQDASQNGLIYLFNVYVSTDGANYTLAAENCEFIFDTVTQTATFPSVPAKFIQIEALETEGGFVSINEFNAVLSEKQPETTTAVESVVITETEAPGTEPEEVTEPAAETESPAPQTADITSLSITGIILSITAVVIFYKKQKYQN